MFDLIIKTHFVNKILLRYFQVFKFVVVKDKSYFVGWIGRENIFWIRFLIYVHISYNYSEIGFWSIDY